MTGYTYTKADFERMDFRIHLARKGCLLTSLEWCKSPQGYNFWFDAIFTNDRDIGDALNALADMVAQYEAIHASTDEVAS